MIPKLETAKSELGIKFSGISTQRSKSLHNLACKDGHARTFSGGLSHIRWTDITVRRLRSSMYILCLCGHELRMAWLVRRVAR